VQPGGVLKGYNVDWFGSGGVARAVVYALLKRGVRELLLCDLLPAKAAALVREFADLAELDEGP
jgi:shikimate 5-dehydrogenase